MKKKKNAIQDDKIFSNGYNQGSIDHEWFSDLKIDSGYSDSYLDNVYNTEEYIERKELDEKILSLFQKSRWFHRYHDHGIPIRKKFPKDHLPHIFLYFRKGLDNQSYTSVDMFIAISDFLDVSYEKLYDLIGMKYKEEILIELEKKYKIISNKNEKKLF